MDTQSWQQIIADPAGERTPIPQFTDKSVIQLTVHSFTQSVNQVLRNF